MEIDEDRFLNQLALDLFYGQRVRSFPSQLVERGQNKLKLVFAAARVEDLAVPPGNRLELLKGDRKGRYSIRINDQWRICFRWDGAKTVDIEVVDYH